jgi:hypothetical protein
MVTEVSASSGVAGSSVITAAPLPPALEASTIEV